MSEIFKGGFNFDTGKCKPLEKRKSVKDAVMSEKIIQRDFFAWKKMHEREYPRLKSIFAVPNGIWTFKSMAVEMVKQGMTAGIPDIICLHPSICGKYHGLLIEFKTLVSRTSDEQEFFLEFFAGLGYRTEVRRNWWDAAHLINEHLDINIPIYSRK